MTRNDCGRSRCPVGATVCKLALTILVALTVASSAPGAPNKGKDQEFTQVYQHTYDEVFQASQQTIERMGMFVDAKDKDKGMIGGSGDYRGGKTTFDILVETLNTKPETKVTINAKTKGWGMVARATEKGFKVNFLRELQQVLSTYQ